MSDVNKLSFKYKHILIATFLYDYCSALTAGNVIYIPIGITIGVNFLSNKVVSKIYNNSSNFNYYLL